MEEDEIERYISADERDAISLEDFAWPEERKYPVRNQDELDSCAKLIGRAPEDKQASIQARAITIAKRKKLSLPESWQKDEDGSEERMAENATASDTIDRADNQPGDISFYAPFIRVDDKSDKREVVGKATRGTPVDTYGTVITYDGSKKAFARAKRIPLREMHQAKAVGKGLEWWGDDPNEDIYLHSYISRGAQDTWTKVQEDVLVGYSIKGRNAKYGTIMRDGKAVAAIVDYDLVEVSLVDNPSCPGCDIAIMRGDGIEAVIATDEEMAELSQKEQPAPEVTPVAQPGEIERAGARLSADSRTTLHSMRDQAMQLCNCDQCQAMMKIDSDGSDGDEDDMPERVERMVASSMSAVYTRMQAMLGEFARRQSEVTTLLDAFERMNGTLAQTANKADVDAKMDKVLAELEQVKGLFERVASTPLPGGPHTGRATTKHLATDGASPSEQETPDILRQINNAGVSLTSMQQAQLVASSLKRV